jgi:hypothetical protein
MKKLLVALLLAFPSYASQIVNPGGSGNAILLQSTLQSGATFYVSSGSVNGTFLAARASGLLGVGNGSYGDFFATTPKFSVWGSTSTNNLELDTSGNFAVGDLSGAGATPAAMVLDQTNGLSVFLGNSNIMSTDSSANIAIGGIYGVPSPSPISLSVPSGYVFFGNSDGAVQIGDLSSFSNGVQLEVNQQFNHVAVQASQGLRLTSDSANDIVFTLPTSSGTSGQFLSTDGSANLSWQNGTTSTAWTTFVPTTTFSGTFTVSSGSWRRVGDSMEVMTFFKTSAAGDGSVFEVSIPAGKSINTSKLPVFDAGGDGNAAVGIMGGYVSSYINYVVIPWSTTSVAVLINGGSTTFKNSNFGTNYFTTLKFTIPISGWN